MRRGTGETGDPEDEEMTVTITKAISNLRYARRKKDIWLSWMTKRIWLAEEIPVAADGSVIYRLQSRTGFSAEGRIHGAGRDENGFYIVFSMDPCDMDNDAAYLQYRRIPLGEATLTEIFNPNTDANFRALAYGASDYQHSFSGSQMRFSRSGDALLLTFELRALLDTVFHIELAGIKSEVLTGDQADGLEDFCDGRIREVYFRKSDEKDYLIQIDNTAKEYSAQEKTDSCSASAAGKAVIPPNRYIIRCSDMKVRKSNYFYDSLSREGIKWEAMHLSNPQAAEELRKKWKAAFLKGVDTAGIFIDDFLWHVFSYERLPAAVGAKACERVDRACDQTLYIFFNDCSSDGTDVCYRLDDASAFTHKMIQCYEDIYVVNRDFTWTYVLTHEPICGPYFHDKATAIP